MRLNQKIATSIDPNFNSLLAKMNEMGISFYESYMQETQNFVLQGKNISKADNILYNIFDEISLQHIYALKNSKTLKHYKVSVDRSHSKYVTVYSSAEDQPKVIEFILADLDCENYEQNSAIVRAGDEVFTSCGSVKIEPLLESNFENVDPLMVQRVEKAFKGLTTLTPRDQAKKKLSSIRVLSDSYNLFCDDDYIVDMDVNRSFGIHNIHINNFVSVFKDLLNKMCLTPVSTSQSQELFVAYFNLPSWHFVSQTEKSLAASPYVVTYTQNGETKTHFVKSYQHAVAFADKLSSALNHKMKLLINGTFEGILFTDDSLHFSACPTKGVFPDYL